MVVLVILSMTGKKKRKDSEVHGTDVIGRAALSSHQSKLLELRARALVSA